MKSLSPITPILLLAGSLVIALGVARWTGLSVTGTLILALGIALYGTILLLSQSQPAAEPSVNSPATLPSTTIQATTGDVLSTDDQDAMKNELRALLASLADQNADDILSTMEAQALDDTQTPEIQSEAKAALLALKAISSSGQIRAWGAHEGQTLSDKTSE